MQERPPLLLDECLQGFNDRGALCVQFGDFKARAIYPHFPSDVGEQALDGAAMYSAI
jgi:hypothetical protein